MIHKAAPVQEAGQGILAGLSTQGQGPVLGTEQQHPEGRQIVAHQLDILPHLSASRHRRGIPITG